MPIQWNVVDPNAPRTLADIFNPASQRMRQAQLQTAEQQAQGLELQNVERMRQLREAELASQQKAQLAPQMQAAERQKQVETYSRQIDSMIANDLRAGIPREQIVQRASNRAKQFGFTDEQISQGLQPLNTIQDTNKAYEHYLFASNPEEAQKAQMKQAFAPQKPIQAPKTVTYKSGGKEITEEWDPVKGQWKTKGVSEKPMTEAEAKIAAKKGMSTQLLSTVDQAEKLLKKAPTASGLGAAVDVANRWFGLTTEGAKVAAELETLSGWMVANVPRMEGPQSNIDVQNYQVMAAKVGDRSVPVGERLAALKTLKELQKKYDNLNKGLPAESVDEGWEDI